MFALVSMPLMIAWWAGLVVMGVIAASAFRWPDLARLGGVMLPVTLAISTAYLALRWAAIGHPPIFGTYENTAAAAWSLLAFSQFAQARIVDLRHVWRVAVPWCSVLLAWGLRYPSRPVPLTISEQSAWVEVHASFAWAAFVPLLLAGSLAVSRLVNRRGDDSRLPHVIRSLLSWGFVAFTGMLVTGVWYLNVLFGVFWRWEVVETVCLVVWICYAVIVHGILFRRWNAFRLLVPVALMVPLLLFGFFVWSVFPGTYHYFDIPLVRPY